MQYTLRYFSLPGCWAFIDILGTKAKWQEKAARRDDDVLIFLFTVLLRPIFFRFAAVLIDLGNGFSRLDESKITR